MNKIEDAYFQSVNNHYAKFDYKRMNTVGVTDYTNWAPLNISKGKMSKFNTHQNVHKIEGAHLQCVNNHYATFEDKGINTVEVTDNKN